MRISADHYIANLMLKQVDYFLFPAPPSYQSGDAYPGLRDRVGVYRARGAVSERDRDGIMAAPRHNRLGILY